jgi:hypothetical protein
VDTVYEANLSNMSPDQLVAILTAVQRRYRSDTWSVDDAQLVFEIREELTRRGYRYGYLGSSSLHTGNRRDASGIGAVNAP